MRMIMCFSDACYLPIQLQTHLSTAVYKIPKVANTVNALTFEWHRFKTHDVKDLLL
jgi:hypothetical protein